METGCAQRSSTRLLRCVVLELMACCEFGQMLTLVSWQDFRLTVFDR